MNETEIEAIVLALNWLNYIPDQALKSASTSVLAKLNAVLPEHRQQLLQQTTLRAINVWLPLPWSSMGRNYDDFCVRCSMKYQFDPISY